MLCYVATCIMDNCGGKHRLTPHRCKKAQCWLSCPDVAGQHRGHLASAAAKAARSLAGAMLPPVLAVNGQGLAASALSQSVAFTNPAMMCDRVCGDLPQPSRILLATLCAVHKLPDHSHTFGPTTFLPSLRSCHLSSFAFCYCHRL